MANNANKIVLLTGGSRGLGKESALQLAKNGFDVIITYQSNKTDAENVVNEIKALGRKSASLPLDLGKVASFDGFVSDLKDILEKDFGKTTIDSLVNNAGTGYYASIEETTEEAFDEMATTHLKAPFFLTQKLLSIINEGGSIINTSSGLARFSYPNYAAYAIMKAGIDTLTRYQALEFGAKKIRVNSIAPGAIATDFGGGAVRDNKALNDMVASNTALGRVGLPDDIGSVIVFLCSEDSKWINAQRIEVAGGVHI
ncbi:SDR family NAD(P)-dependent oxidoreductase [Arcicella rosea]|uniref:NAD(P)-dependent dehydrogenase (Short-subunit alcohol dehydrogenase family) n=1 Tax=Arcicella rosea TaxID=502909 RepID=A0A841ER18_9BACT|nr:SDR family oxidoreductase [Arcicella rosea]MBB6003463.1 NAD(P)-dependent dehydrogenase (short-subunit alcohol dehydrogenase family) [Arcicella rosea]